MCPSFLRHLGIRTVGINYVLNHIRCVDGLPNLNAAVVVYNAINDELYNNVKSVPLDLLIQSTEDEQVEMNFIFPFERLYIRALQCIVLAIFPIR
jgi:hypothetical protein